MRQTSGAGGQAGRMRSRRRRCRESSRLDRRARRSGPFSARRGSHWGGGGFCFRVQGLFAHHRSRYVRPLLGVFCSGNTPPPHPHSPVPPASAASGFRKASPLDDQPSHYSSFAPSITSIAPSRSPLSPASSPRQLQPPSSAQTLPPHHSMRLTHPSPHLYLFFGGFLSLLGSGVRHLLFTPKLAYEFFWAPDWQKKDGPDTWGWHFCPRVCHSAPDINGHTGHTLQSFFPPHFLSKVARDFCGGLTRDSTRLR
jgi:hypothetical protein